MTPPNDLEWGAKRISDWRRRGLDLWKALGPELCDHVPLECVEALLAELIHPDNPACADAGNAAHVMAQNDNLVVLARWAKAPARELAIALAGGFVHDLNKASGEVLRADRYAVYLRDGSRVETIDSEPLVVGLNHYGERTRAAIFAQVDDGLPPEVAEAIDACIVHHGLGSSRFIAGLVRGELGFGRDDFLSEDTEPRFILPDQPPLTLASVLHDLADSVQQMQAGAAWVSKYPLGYWRSSGSSWHQLLSGDGQDGDVPTGLEGQLRVELSTCQAILRRAIEAGIVNRSLALRLERGVEALIGGGRAWVDARDETLLLPRGETVYHQLAAALGGTSQDARELLEQLRPGDDPRLDARILRAAQTLDAARAH
ncbi:MAG: hypothetical protein AAFZ18_37955, partial [Myxococcota bacterium]